MTQTYALKNVEMWPYIIDQFALHRASTSYRDMQREHPIFPEISASIQNISTDTFYDPDGTQPTGYVGQVSLNSIQ